MSRASSTLRPSHELSEITDQEFLLSRQNLKMEKYPIHVDSKSIVDYTTFNSHRAKRITHKALISKNDCDSVRSKLILSS